MVVGATVVELGEEGLEVPDPEPMAVVIGPDSMYTPDTYQSSGASVFTMRRTPTWKSSELVDVGAAMFCATLVSGAEPVEAHKPTVPAENYKELLDWGLIALIASASTYVDIVCKVKPCPGGKGCAPMRDSLHHPLQISRAWTDTVFQLWEI